MTQYVSVRLKKVRTAGDLANFTRHGRREPGSFKKSLIDPDRSHLNKHWQFDRDTEDLEECDVSQVDYGEAVEKLRVMNKAKRAKNSAMCTEMLFTASPGFFDSPDGSIDRDKAEKWFQACLTAAQERYPGMVAAARLDLDETTPHGSIFILPMYEKSYSGEKRKSTRAPRKTVSHNKVFGGRQDYRNLQDWAGRVMSQHGFDLVRGRPIEETRLKNFPPAGKLMQQAWNFLSLAKAEKAKYEKGVKVNDALLQRFKAFGLTLEPFKDQMTPIMAKTFEWFKGRDTTRSISSPGADPAGSDLSAGQGQGGLRQSPEPPERDPPPRGPKL